MLNEKIKVNKLELSNRIVQPPMATEKSVNGQVSGSLCQYYKDRSGYTGLIITEHSYIMKNGKASRNQLSVGKDANVEELKKLVDAIHSQPNTKVFAQINHAGCKAKQEVTGEEVIDINLLTKEELNEIKEAFVYSALLVKEAGYDGVEIHGAHGYLNCQMYSPLINHRTDEYTGSTMDGRTKFQCEVIEAVRKAVGDDYPIAYRFGACDYQEGGSTEEEAGIAAKKFVEAGADMLDVSGGMNGYVIPGNTNPGWFSHVGKIVKDAVDVPVMIAGGITTKEDAERVLSEKCCDLVGVGRVILRDPNWSKNNL